MVAVLKEQFAEQQRKTSLKELNELNECIAKTVALVS